MIIKNRFSENILDFLTSYLPVRKEMKEKMDQFIDPGSSYEPQAQKVTKPEKSRYDKNVEKLIAYYEQVLDTDALNFYDPEYFVPLKSFSGETLKEDQTLQILNSNQSGRKKMEEYMIETLVEKKRSIHDHIPKVNTPTFKSENEAKKKKPTRNRSTKKELKDHVKFLHIVSDRNVMSMKNANKYQPTDIMALTKIVNNKVVANIPTNKSNTVKFLEEIAPESFSHELNTDSFDMTIIEMENLIVSGSLANKTLREILSSFLLFKIKPLAASFKNLVLLFDDPIHVRTNDVKQTYSSRYSSEEYKDLVLTEDLVISDMTEIFRNQHNKESYKKVLLEYIRRNANKVLKNGSSLFLNGTFDDTGVVKQISMTDNVITEVDREDLRLKPSETDEKLFFLMRKVHILGAKKFLVHSLDCDVKILSIYWSSLMPDVEIVIKSSKSISSTYFYPGQILRYMSAKYICKSQEDLARLARSLLRTYIILGNDCTPSFRNYSHTFGLQVFDKLSKESILESEDDFLFFIMKMYQEKNGSLRKMTIKRNVQIDEQIMEARCILKSVKGVEEEAIPLPSCLKLQFQRSVFQVRSYSSEEIYLNPEDYGYTKKQVNFEVQLQNQKDPYYLLPKELFKGCSCKSECGLKCSCMKTDKRGRKCSKITCKCSCEEDTVRSDLDSDPDDTEGFSGEESDLDFPVEYDDFETFDTYDPIDFDFT